MRYTAVTVCTRSSCPTPRHNLRSERYFLSEISHGTNAGMMIAHFLAVCRVRAYFALTARARRAGCVFPTACRLHIFGYTNVLILFQFCCWILFVLFSTCRLRRLLPGAFVSPSIGTSTLGIACVHNRPHLGKFSLSPSGRRPRQLDLYGCSMARSRYRKETTPAEPPCLECKE